MTTRNPGGRPPLPPEKRLLKRSLHLSNAAWEKVDQGGPKWLRALVDGNEPPFTREQVRALLRGIDETEGDGPDGWWETSTGAEFGAKKLSELEALLFGAPPTRKPAK